MNEITIDKIKEAANELAPRYKVKRLYLIGDYAYGKVKKKSLIEFRYDNKRSMSLLHLVAFERTMREKLGKKIDMMPSDLIGKEGLEELKGKEILIYEGK